MSFFGKKASNPDNAGKKNHVRPTGGKIDEIVMALVSNANDKESGVRSSVFSGLEDLAHKHPELVLSSCLQFISSSNQRPHVIILLQLILRVLEHDLYNISEELGVDLITMALGEMTKEKSVVPEWQGPSSAILVSLGRRFPAVVWKRLVELFPPGTLPHYFVIKTMGDISVANPMEIVPSLKEVMARTLPILGNVKKDNLRWVFAAAFGHWCDAVLAYLANLDKAVDKSVSLETFSSEVYPAYEMFFNNWITSRESKVRLAVAQAVGNMCAVMPQEQFEAQLPRLLPGLLSLYKKEKSHLPITQALTMLLSASVKNESQMLEPQLNVILNVIHPLVCQPGIFEDPEQMKNANELLRCFEIIGYVFSDQLLEYLLLRLDLLKQKSATIRAGTLNIVRHLITRLDDQLADKKERIISGVKPLVESETTLDGKRVLAQLVIAMSSHDYLLLEGGESLVEFVVRQSAITDEEVKKFDASLKKSKKTVDLTPGKFRGMCDNILHLATTTVPSMQQVLWPYLFEFLVKPQYTDALAIVCRCIGHLAAAKREEQAPDYLLDFGVCVNVPQPAEIIARLLVMLNVPLRRGQLGRRILECLVSIGPILHPNIVNMWDAAIPKLMNYLDTHTGQETWDISTWEDLCLRLLSETIKQVNDEGWIVKLVDALCEQLPSYAADADLSRSAMKHLGVMLQKSTKKDMIRDKLDFLFNTAVHENEVQRQGCAQAYGYCSAAHLDMVLDKLKAAGKETKASGGFFSFLSSTSGPSQAQKNTIFLSLGYVTAYAQPSLVIARLDAHIFATLETHLKAAKAPDVKENVIKSIDLIGKALHPDHLQEQFTFKRRDDLVQCVLNYMTTGDVTDQVKLLGLNAITTLATLEPAIPEELEGKLMEGTMKFYYDGDPSDNKKMKPEQLESVKQSYDLICDNFHEMVHQMLMMDTSCDRLRRLVLFLSGPLNSPAVSKRRRACQAILALFKKFVEFKSGETGPKSEELFDGVGNLMGMFVPRCTDEDTKVRLAAMECIEACLFINNMLKTSVNGDTYNLQPPKALQIAPELRRNMVIDEVNKQFALVHKMSQVIATLISEQELPAFLLSCIEGLRDPLTTSSSGTCVMLNGILKARGDELKDRVCDLVDRLVSAMDSISDEKTMNGSLHSLRSLAHHHLLGVLDQLLASPLASATSHSETVVRSIQTLAKDSSLVTQMVDHLTDIINNSQVLEDDGKKPKHNPRALSATCALGEMFEVEEMESVVNEQFGQIFCSLLLRFGTTRYSDGGKASQQIENSFKKFLTCIDEADVLEALGANDHWTQLRSNEKYHYSLTEIVRVECESRRDMMGSFYEFLLPYLHGNFMGQRIVTAAIFAEMVSHCNEDKELLQSLINNLLTIMVDDTLKLMACRGLGNIAAAGKEEVNRFASTVIDALMCSIDSPDETLAMEAMNGLARVFELVDERCVAPILVNICHRIRPAFEHKSGEIRAASIQLFGTLHRFGHAEGQVIFNEQLHNNLPSLYLHIFDPDNSVSKASKVALKRLVALMHADEIAEFFNEYLDEDRQLNLKEFLNRLSVLLITYFPERLNYYVMTSIEYFKSDWVPLRVGAAAFVGFAMGNVPQERQHAVGLNPGIITSELVKLLKVKEAEVRAMAANGLSTMHNW